MEISNKTINKWNYLRGSAKYYTKSDQIMSLASELAASKHTVIRSISEKGIQNHTRAMLREHQHKGLHVGVTKVQH